MFVVVAFLQVTIASRMDKEIKEKNLEEKYSIEFLPFGLGLKELDRFDVQEWIKK